MRPPRESGTMAPIEMPFGTFDYLIADLIKFPELHRASPIGRGPRRGRSTPVDYCRFICFYSCHCHCYLFFIELVHRSESNRQSQFFAPKGAIPLVHVPFCGFRATNS